MCKTHKNYNGVHTGKYSTEVLGLEWRWAYGTTWKSAGKDEEDDDRNIEGQAWENHSWGNLVS